MPSELIIPITEIRNLRNHPNGDRIEIAEILGWQIVVGKGLYTEGQKLIYCPPDSVLPLELSDALDITKFLSNGRVRQVKLRGEPSFGATIPLEIAEKYGVDPNLPLGTNVAEKLNITKYEPPVRVGVGDAEVEHPLFIKYTSINNIRNYPNIIKDGEEVLILEKLHGSNCRVGLIEGEYMAGSHSVRRKLPENMETNMYWYPLSLNCVKNLLNYIKEEHNAKQIILFGEIYGKVQKKYNYGAKDRIDFRAFDLLIDGKYLNYEEFSLLCEKFGVPQVPFLDIFAYDYSKIVDYMEGFKHSELSESHPMEGGVIKPLNERQDSTIGRVILKYITNSYLFDSGKSDYKDN